MLQKYVKIELNKELKLILDVRTSWNSLVAMLERFIVLKSYILKAVMDLNLEPVNISAEEYFVLNAAIMALQPIKIGTARLGRREATLLDAESVSVFVLDDLHRNKNCFSCKLLQSAQEWSNDGTKM